MKNLSALKKILRDKFDDLFCKRNYSIKKFGSPNSWNVCIKELNKDSIVYSFGVGHDITFEKELSESFGCKIYLYDPSPTGIKTMNLSENKSELILFKPVGVAKESGVIRFSAPKDEAEGSYRLHEDGKDKIEFICKDLSSLMKENKSSHIDLLKMDIEGFEYEVLDSMLESGLVVKQLCCEFHHFMKYISLFSTLNVIRKLNNYGYKLVYKNRYDYTFIKVK